MKKMVLCTLCILSHGVAYALPVGNPAEASIVTQGICLAPYCLDSCDPCFSWIDAWSFKFGFYGDYVFNRHLKVWGGTNDLGEDIRRTRLFTNAGYLAISLCNKVDVFGTVGATRITIATSDLSWGGTGSEGRLDWKSTVSWSAGARGTLLHYRRFAIGVEGQYFQTRPHLNDFMSVFDGRYDYFNRRNKMRYEEWQGGVGFSYFLSQCCSEITVVPYVASKWSWARFHTRKFTFTKASTRQTLTIFNMKASRFWGAAVGVTMAFFNRADVTVEGRFGDESAIYVNGTLRF